MSRSPSSLISDARARAHLTQAELARRSGIAQSSISAYENGRREPGLKALSTLVEATGHRLVLEALAPEATPRALPTTRLGRRLRRRRASVLATAERYGARNVRVFGSVARGEDKIASDIDLLVDLDIGVGLVALAGLTRELTELLRVPVDVVPAGSLKPTSRHDALAEAIPL